MRAQRLDSANLELAMFEDEDNEAGTGYSRWKTSSEAVSVTLPKLGLRDWQKSHWFVLVIAVIVTLVLGFIIGYLVRGARPNKAETFTVEEPSILSQQYTAGLYDELLMELNTTSIRHYVNDFQLSNISYHPGSSATNLSAHELSYGFCHSVGLMLKQVVFKKALLSHPVRSSVFLDGVLVEGTNESQPIASRPYAAYTHSGTASGLPSYAGFGDVDGFQDDPSVYNNSICLINLGKINVNNKIHNAYRMGCVGVILFINYTTADVKERAFVNAKQISGDPQTPSFASYSDVSYQLTMEEVKSYFPPPIPVVTGSRRLFNNLTNDIESVWTASSPKIDLLELSEKSVQIISENQLVRSTIHESICAIRGSTDGDKFVIVGTRHDEVGCHRQDVATSQGIMRELLRLLATSKTFKPRRSIIFLTTDASELNVGTQEWIEENEREFGERVVAYVNIGGMRHNADTLQIVKTPLMQHLVQSVSNDSLQTGLRGSHHFRAWYSTLAVPTVDLTAIQGDASIATYLPSCGSSADQSNYPAIDQQLLKRMAAIYLKVIMRLSDDPILSYDLLALKDLLRESTKKLHPFTDRLDSALLKSFTSSLQKLAGMLQALHKKITSVAHAKLSDIKYRRINDALMGATRAFILPQGVPMVEKDKNDNVVITSNLNNKNMLFGSISSTDDEITTFPGLMELLQQPETDAMRKALKKHLTEIQIAISRSLDYTMRAIIYSDTFTE